MTKDGLLAAGVVALTLSAADAASARGGTVYALARTRSAGGMTDTRRWCERVSVSAPL
jgi:hypothetical protein